MRWSDEREGPRYRHTGCEKEIERVGERQGLGQKRQTEGNVREELTECIMRLSGEREGPRDKQTDRQKEIERVGERQKRNVRKQI
jgi:hypothetical protein